MSKANVVMEARQEQRAPFTFKSAYAIGGKREYRFLNASDMYEWIQANRPDIFAKKHGA